MPHYVELKAKSAYSLLEGALRVKELAGICKAAEMPAIGIADTNNLFGSLEISQTLAGAGIQPIIGCALSLKLDEGEGQRRRPGETKLWQGRPRLAVYPKSEAGYRALTRLDSRARAENDPAEPFITFEDLEAAGEELLILTGGPDGPINRLIADNQVGAAEALLDRLREIAPGRLYVELQRHGLAEETRAEGFLVDWAYAKGLPLVATNEPHFKTADMYEAHDALLCVAGNTVVMEDDRRRLTPEHYFKGAKEMSVLFADLPEALEMTLEVARRVSYRPCTHDPIMPSFPIETGESERDVLRRRAREGLTQRFKAAPPVVEESEYFKRLDYELEVIEAKGFPGYFLIVADFIAWSKAHGIAVGPGRGSGAGSLVAYALTITDVDPMRWGLLFERFLNPERKSMPDFDIDFCPVRRDEVFEYVRGKYGEDRVAQIITFGKLQARAVLRDVGRVLAMPYGQVDRLCKLVPNNPAKPVTLAEAVDSEPRLQEERDKDETVARLLDMALKLEGLYRHSSTHAAGVVIGDKPLQEVIPITRDPGSEMLVTQLDMKWVEPAGLIKFDFLALKTLSVLQRAEQLVRASGKDISLESLPLDDKRSFEMLSRADVTGVFQLESQGMRDVLKKLKPDRFTDIIALVALYRPGPMDDIPRYIACKNGTEPVTYLHPMLEPILKESYGVLVYQDQALLTAINLAGYGWGEVDILRKAMGKKIKAEMDRQKVRFIEGCVERGIDKASADHIFETISKFAGYGFNKAHAAAYALVAYQTAYMKANYPLEFMAATMSLDLANTDKLAVLKRAAEEMGLKVLPPDINRSGSDFVVKDGAIFYGLAAIKSVGKQAMDEIEAERERGGPYKDLFDFLERIGPPIINRRALETLAKAGAFDSLYENRAEIVASAEMLAAFASRAAEDRASNQTSLFGGDLAAPERPRLTATPAWPVLERLQAEAEAVGFYISGHPLDDYARALRQARVIPFAELAGDPKRLSRRVQLAGTIISKKERRSQRTDQPYAFVEFTDPSGHFEAVIFSDLLRANREDLEPGKSVVIGADADWEGEDLRLRVQSIKSLEAVAAEAGEGIRIHIDSPSPLTPIASQLKTKGKGKVSLIVEGSGGRRVEVELPERFQIGPRVRGLLKAVPGVLEIEEL